MTAPAPALPHELLSELLTALRATRDALATLLGEVSPLPEGRLSDLELVVVDVEANFAPTFLLADPLTGRCGVWMPSTITHPVPQPGDAISVASAKVSVPGRWWTQGSARALLPRISHLRSRR